jgi:A/G-specific adenine glycosylase
MANYHLLQNPIDAETVLRWYEVHARDLPWRLKPSDREKGGRPDPYRVWLSEIMLQQTTVATVRNYYPKFLERWPTVADLATAPLYDVLAQWAGLGYYTRARNLHACAIAVVERFGGRWPETSAELQTLPGIGPYSAAAIAAIAFDERVAVIDGNVERVIARFVALEAPVNEAKDAIRAILAPAIPALAGDFAQALMDLGATLCAPRATACMLCPLRPGCAGARLDPLKYPVKGRKAERPMRYGHAFVMRDAAGDVYLQARPESGLLARMAETPTSEWTLVRESPCFPVTADWARTGQVIHLFTHFRLELEVWSATVDPALLSAGWWASPADFAAEALPTLFRKVLAVSGVSHQVSAARTDRG